VRKNFRGNKVAFVNELEAALDLKGAGCQIPAILRVDFERLSITFAYIDGVVVRQALAQAGAPMRDRDVTPVRSRLGNYIMNNRVHKKRIEGRKVPDRQSPKLAKQSRGTGKALLAVHRAGYTLEDVKYGNVIIEAKTNVPYFVDFERALPLRRFSRTTATYLCDRDAGKLNRLLAQTSLPAMVLRRVRLPAGDGMYSPFYAGAGIWWGAIWNPEPAFCVGAHILAKHVPVPVGGRVLDLGANNGF